jgi:hypothetical protein
MTEHEVPEPGSAVAGRETGGMNVSFEAPRGGTTQHAEWREPRRFKDRVQVQQTWPATQDGPFSGTATNVPIDRHRKAVSPFSVTFQCHLSVSPFCVTFQCHLSLRSCVTFRCVLVSPFAAFLCHRSLRSCVTFRCVLSERRSCSRRLLFVTVARARYGLVRGSRWRRRTFPRR